MGAEANGVPPFFIFRSMNGQSGIPYYREINDFLASISPRHRTGTPDLYCLRLHPDEPDMATYKPPFRKDFYFIALVSNAGKTTISFDSTQVSTLNAFLVFQSPGLLYSFHRDPSANGYLIYFKKDCFSFFKPGLEAEFPFFSLLNTHFIKLNETRFAEFTPLFEDVFQAAETAAPDISGKLVPVKLLGLLYQLKSYTQAFAQWEEGFTAPQQLLLNRFIQLVNNFYLEKRTIGEYANLLNVTPNHLSQTIKSASGRNALSFISERLASEAKSMIQFSGLDIAEIAYRLQFSDPANFGKFFKKNTGFSPLEFRKHTAREKSTS